MFLLKSIFSKNIGKLNKMQINKITCVYIYEASQKLIIYISNMTNIISKTSISIAVIASAIILSVAFVSANNTEENKKGQHHENKAEIQIAVENGNYEEFARLTTGKKIAEKITAENFPKFQELHSLQKQAKEIREELELPNKKEKNKKCNRNKGENGENRENGESGEKRGDRENNKNKRDNRNNQF